jgi:signal transduction histidine kinase
LTATRVLALAIDDEALAALRAVPPDPGPAAAMARQVELAWHLRQRDTAAALQHAQAAEEDLAAGIPGSGTGLNARLQVLRAEVHWLHADLAAAELAARRAEDLIGGVRHGPNESPDALVCLSDVESMLAQCAFDRMDVALACSHMEQARALALQASDMQRALVAEDMQAYWGMVVGTAYAELAFSDSVAQRLSHADPLVALWARDLMAQVLIRQDRYAEAIAAFTQVADEAARIGQRRRAIVACSNVCACFLNLGDHEAALEWVERLLGLARPTAWPGSLGNGLTTMANLLRHMGRLDDARTFIDEALEVLAPLSRSRLWAVALGYSGEVAIEQQDCARAEHDFAAQIALAEATGLVEIAIMGRRGRAEALSGLGRAREAKGCALEALHQSERQASAVFVFDALSVLAGIHQIHDLPAPPGLPEPSACLHYQQRAIEVGRSIDGFEIPARSWEALAREQARLGDHVAAYRSAVEAAAMREREHAQAATHRAIAMAARLQTERMRTEGARLREQAQAAAQRAELLQDTNAVLEQLGAMGQEITAQLDIDRVFKRIHAHLQALLDAQHLAIWLLDDAGQTLHLRFGIEGGQPLPPAQMPMSQPHSNVARCVREGLEVLHAPDPAHADPTHMPGSLRTLTALFGPLRVRDRLLGVMSVQSEREHAYGERERLIFRSLCAYGAIALDNASAYQQLESARQQLEAATRVKSEFLANISHDLRTPLASLHGYLETLLLSRETVTEDDRQRYLRTALRQSEKVSRLARELLELARLEAGAVEFTPERFSLVELAQDVLQKMEFAARQRSQHLGILVDPGLPDVYADIAMTERVLTNLLDNAVTHAPVGSQVRLEVRMGRRQIQVAVLDTGPGVSPDLREGLFTRPSAIAREHRPGGAGLGLLIVQRLLQRHGSEVCLVERAGFGAAFEFALAPADGL